MDHRHYVVLKNGERIKVPPPKAWEYVDTQKATIGLSNILKEINVSAFARKICMNESLLRKYKNGIVKPSDKQLKRIESAIHEMGNRLKKIKLYYEKVQSNNSERVRGRK